MNFLCSYATYALRAEVIYISRETVVLVQISTPSVQLPFSIDTSLSQHGQPSGANSESSTRDLHRSVRWGSGLKITLKDAHFGIGNAVIIILDI